jgi:UDP-4-amino-4,6-dideoxy-N-acetyl-beta-L-altrosamine N-acetyltransferase
MVFADEVIRFRAIELQDLESLRNWINDPETARYLAMSWPVSTRDQQDWFEKLRKDSDRKKLVIELTQGELIGMVSFMNMDYRNRSVEIGITIGNPEYRAKGLASRALNLAVRVLFAEFNFHRIWAEILETNEPCLRLFKQADFEQEGLLRESVYWDGRMIGKIIMAKLRR